MSEYKIGDKSKAICHYCEKIVTTTFDRRIHSGREALYGVCDECDRVVSIPHGESMSEEKKGWPYNIKTEYRIVQSKKIPRLIEYVNKHIADGWEPLGGVTISFCESVGMVCQAMIKRHDT